jgi:protein phosphatase
MKMRFAYYTNRGAKRTDNQDALFLDGCVVFGDMSVPTHGIYENEERAFFAVIDGVGGHSSGEIASRTVAAEFVKRFYGSTLDTEQLSTDFLDIQETMTEIAAKIPELSGMAATLAGAVIDRDKVLAFNVGDCRTYLMKRGFLDKITHDHSIVQDLKDNGVIISDDEMRFHPQKNRVTSTLMAGESEPPAIFTNSVPLSNESELLFICSDGVWESLSIEAIEDAVSPAADDINTAAKRLVAALTSSKPRDNVSFVILTLNK